MNGVSLTRLYLLRACYLLLFAGLSIEVVPDLFGPVAGMRPMDGAAVSMLSALAGLSVLGLLAPLRMLPLLLFEMAWKLIWTLSVALPHWLAGTADADIVEMMFAVSLILPFFFIMPWRYAAAVFRTSLDPWRPEKRF